jgi:DNA repair exonuclease SbcCD nuclease subunit
MTQIAITADIHLGVPSRLDDILWSLRVIREYCKLSKIDTVLVLGDLYHDRRTIEIDVLSRSIEFFDTAKNIYNQDWVAFPGNHDMFLRYSWEINSLAAIKKYVTIIEGVKLLTIDESRFWVIPFVTQEKSFLKILRKVETKYQEGDVLLTHIGVRGSTLNTCFLLKDWSAVEFHTSKFKRVYTGHFHSKQQVGDNVWYPGSPIPFKFDEGDVPHGFYVYDTDTQEHKFINIWKAGAKLFPSEPLPPQFTTLLEETIEELNDTDIKGHNVRVTLQRHVTLEEKRNIKDKLICLGAKSVRWMDLTQKIEKQVNITTAPTKNLFESWVEADNSGTKSLDKKLLYTLNNEIIQEGDEKYSIEESE